MRQTLGHGILQGTFNQTDDLVMSDRITVTYNAISLATEHPAFNALCRHYNFQQLELAWHLMLHLRAPGKLFPHFPAPEEPLIIPASRLPPFNAALTLRSLQ